MGFMSWFTKLGDRKRVLTESEIKDKITELLLEMVWVDGDAHEEEVSHVVHVLAVRFQMSDDSVRQKVDGFKNVTQKDITKLARELQANLSAGSRIAILKDLWTIAVANGFADSYEQALFHRVADTLGITDHHFLDRIVKV